MRIFVISLPTQATRRDFISEQLKRLGLPFRFFDAVDMRDSRTQYFRAYDVDKFELNTGRKPTTNEIGCYASHMMLWRTCITLNEPILILEDDAKLDNRFVDALRFVERRIHGLGFVRLERNPNRLGRTAAANRMFAARYCPKYTYSSMAYAISPNVARAFVDHSRVFETPVDKFIKDCWNHQQPLYQLTPHVAEESVIGTETSSIGWRRKVRQRRLAARVRRVVYKSRCSISRFVFNMSYQFGNRRHAI